MLAAQKSKKGDVLKLFDGYNLFRHTNFYHH